MSLGRRLLDLARANMNALLNRTASGDLEDYSDAELSAELLQREARRRRDEEARRASESAERAARQRNAARASGASSRGADARATGSSSSSRARASASAGSSRAAVDRQKLASLYAQLETPVGSDLEAVRKNFRRLMRKHHPDLQARGVEAQRAATERTKQLTAAYTELEQLLVLRR